jgi:FAD/FMN-containing dehydrogenases
MKNLVIENSTALRGERFATAESVRANYSKGEERFESRLPSGVAVPNTTEEVSEMLKSCKNYKVPIVPFGAGTSLEGQVVGIKDGISMSVENLNKMIEGNKDEVDCRGQAYVTRIQLNNYVKDQGVLFPRDPGAEATIGGKCATSASGTMAVRYGTMRTNVLGFTVVLPNGDIIKTGGRTKKTSSGYNLTGLFIGSEGTLGIITEKQLKIETYPRKYN